MGAQDQPGLDVGIVPPLRSVVPGVVEGGRAGAVAISIVEVGGDDRARAADALGDVAALVE